MNIWEDIVRTALVGTERGPLPEYPAADPLSRLVAALPKDDPEHKLLGAAAAACLYLRAGGLPSVAAGPLPAPSEPETLPHAGEKTMELLAEVLGGRFPEVLPELLGLIAAEGRLVHPRLLPDLLDTGRRRADIRPDVVSVVGRRGEWLAAQYPEWNYVLRHLVRDDDQATWETGGREARAGVLRRLRETEPNRGRDLLSATWKQEGVEERALFLSALGVGLSLDDEAFLEAALGDSRKEVRQVAAELLSTLPESQLSKRMTARLEPLVRLDPKTRKVTVDFPDELDAATIRDGIIANPPNSHIGKRAWRLRQMLGAVPPDFWTRKWGLSVVELIEAAKQGEESEALLEGWTAAAVRCRAAEWAGALLETFDKTGPSVEKLAEVLPAEKREAFAFRHLKADVRAVSADHPAFSVLAACRHQWSKPLAELFLIRLKERIRAQETQYLTDWRTTSHLPQFALRIPPALDERIDEDWPEDCVGWPAWQAQVENLRAIVRFRAEIHRSLIH